MGTIKAGGFTLEYEIKNESAMISGIDGMDSSLEIPSEVSEGDLTLSVTSIGKKAFLGVNGLRHITVPESVSEIGDWAFSHCRHLVGLVVLNPETAMGRGVLEGCERLKTVCRGYKEADDLAYLMATVVTGLPAGYLLTSSEAGNENWFKNYDSSLLQYLKESDYAGSDESALCGEEDISYDDIRSVDGELLGADVSYILGVRKNKCCLSLLRLKYSTYLSHAAREFLLCYIKERTVSHSNNSAWLAVRDDLYDDASFLEIYLNATEPSPNEIEKMLDNLGNEHPEMKAQLLNRRAGVNMVDDFFEDLLL